MKKNIYDGARQAILRSLDSAVSSLLALISTAGDTHSLSSAPLVYIRRVHQNASGSVVSELMRLIHHIITPHPHVHVHVHVQLFLME